MRSPTPSVSRGRWNLLDPTPRPPMSPACETATPGSRTRLPSLAAEVHAGFSRKYQDRLTVEQIEEILSAVDLSDTRTPRPTPLLRLRRLRFTGGKLLRGADEACPINYGQRLPPGTDLVII